jgi:hypothetical protein
MIHVLKVHIHNRQLAIHVAQNVLPALQALHVQFVQMINFFIKILVMKIALLD